MARCFVKAQGQLYFYLTHPDNSLPSVCAFLPVPEN